MPSINIANHELFVAQIQHKPKPKGQYTQFKRDNEMISGN